MTNKMNQKKMKIVVIEDKYRQFQIIENLLNPHFEVFPKVIDNNDFKNKKSKLMDYLNNNGNNGFLDELPSFDDISAFVIDYELKKGSNKTGVLFAQITEQINNGSKPVLFLTKMSDSDTTNTITTLPNTNPNIKKEYLRKPESWEDANKRIENIALTSNKFGEEMKTQIGSLINKTTDKNNCIPPDHSKKI
jgi:response regulator RpfG family c-di-GMP phosphodiesterase